VTAQEQQEDPDYQRELVALLRMRRADRLANGDPKAIKEFVTEAVRAELDRRGLIGTPKPSPSS
jgi:hypothetical protein